MMNLNRVQTKKTEPKITVVEKYPNNAVLTLNKINEGSRLSMALNRKAFKDMSITDESNRLICFEKYDTSVEGDGSNLELVIGIVSDEIVKVDKQYRSFDVHLTTRTVKSKDIYNTIQSAFKVNGLEGNIEFYIEPVGEHLLGTFRLVKIEEEAECDDSCTGECGTHDEESITTDLFDKGENLQVTQE